MIGRAVIWHAKILNLVRGTMSPEVYEILREIYFRLGAHFAYFLKKKPPFHKRLGSR